MIYKGSRLSKCCIKCCVLQHFLLYLYQQNKYYHLMIDFIERLRACNYPAYGRHSYLKFWIF